MQNRLGVSGPVEKGDEEELHGGAEPEGSDRFAAEGEVFLGGVQVGDEHGNQQKDQANPRERTKARKQKASGTEELQDAGDVNEQKRLREKGGEHAREVAAHFVEVGAGGEDEHDREGVPGRVVPRGERSNAQSADGTQEEPSDEHHNQHDHAV